MKIPKIICFIFGIFILGMTFEKHIINPKRTSKNLQELKEPPSTFEDFEVASDLLHFVVEYNYLDKKYKCHLENDSTLIHKLDCIPMKEGF